MYIEPFDAPDVEVPDEVVCESGGEKIMLSEAALLIEKIRAIDPDWNPDIHGADGGLI